ncbi:MAG: hypothetical protein AAGA15_00030 [Pseudomonadota bacterium]
MTLLGQYSLYLFGAAAFWIFNRFTVRVAIVVTIVGGYLLLPTRAEIDLPMLPAFNKHSVPVFMVIALLLMRKTPPSGTMRGPIPLNWLPLALVAILFAGIFGTVMTNGDALNIGTRRLQGLVLYDAFSTGLTTLVLLLPLVVGRKYFARAQDHKLLLQLLVLAGLLYSLPALYEVRMSPQLNRMFYGYFSHHWLQHIRGNGFRPLVFLEHGLWLAVFLSGATMAAAGLWRQEKDAKWKTRYLIATIWLYGTLFMSKSLGAFMVTSVLLPLILITHVRLQMMVAAAIAALVLTYPVLRSADVVPVYDFVDFVESNISEDRASSLRFRLEQEDALLEKARERYAFGWGGYGRPRVYDPNTGQDLSTVDGAWIIFLGAGGLANYFTKFGLLSLVVILLWVRAGSFRIGQTTAALMVIMAGNLVDLIPNGGQTVVTWLIAGALWGRFELGRAHDEVPETNTVGIAEPPPSPVASGTRGATVYTRHGPDPARSRTPATAKANADTVTDAPDTATPATTFLDKAQVRDRTGPVYTRQVRSALTRRSKASG